MIHSSNHASAPHHNNGQAADDLAMAGAGPGARFDTSMMGERAASRVPVMPPAPETCLEMHEVLPPSTEPEALMRIISKDMPEPQIDAAFIKAVACSSSHDGGKRVVDHHLAIFDKCQGHKLTLLNQQQAKRVPRVASRERECSRLTGELNSVRQFIPIDPDQPGEDGVIPQPKAWTWMERLEVTSYMIMSGGAIGMAVYNTANLLHKSGETAFLNWRSAFSFALPTVLVAMAFKGINTLVRNPSTLKLIAWCVLVLGGIGIAGWVFAIGDVVARSMDDMPVSYSAMSQGNSATFTPANLGRWLFMGGWVADVCFAVGCWLIVSLIYDEHQRNRLKENPSWLEIRRALNRAHKLLHEEQELLGVIRAHITRLLGARDEFLGRARARFESVQILLSNLN